MPRIMHLLRGTTKVLLCLNVLQVSCQTLNDSRTLNGCAFEELPAHLSIEPASTPLYIDVDILIIGLRKGSGSGDFFGVDAELVCMHLNFVCEYSQKLFSVSPSAGQTNGILRQKGIFTG